MSKSYTETKKNIILIWREKEIIKHISNKKKQLAIESAVILLTETITQRSGKFQLSQTLAQLIITEHNIDKNLR